MLDRPRRSLPVHKVPIHEGVLKQGSHRVDVILPHFPDVLKHETQAFEHAVLHVQFGHAVLIHEGGKHSERATRLSNDRNSHHGADTQLTFLNLQVVEQCAQHVVRTDRLRYVAEGVHGGSPDGFLVGLQQLQKIEANAVPFARRRQLGATVRDTADEIDAILLDLLVAILQDRSQAWQQILDRRRHLCHTDDVHDRLHSAQNRSQDLGVLFTQVLVQEETQVAHHLLLAALFHDHGNARDQIRSLLPHSRGRRVEPPTDDTGDLRQVRLHTGPQGVHHGAEAVEHDRRVVRGLLLERVHDAVDDLLLEARVDVRHAEVGDHLIDGLHHHLPVWLGRVLQVLDNPPDDVGATNLVRDLDGRVHQLPIVAAIEGHADHPEVAEERGQNILADVVRLHTFGGDALLHDLQDDLLHLLVRS
mmetsp:Transcript_86974/g.243811  ORF Transcript_86974/g.243811 Transcript_86974/m.243811 type:complete len:418 (+) Transcript_86974:455-1708(+)